MGDSSPGLDPLQDEALFGPEESNDSRFSPRSPLPLTTNGIQLPPPTTSSNVSPLPSRHISPLPSILTPTPYQNPNDQPSTSSTHSKRREKPLRRKSSTPALFIPKSNKGSNSTSQISRSQTPTIVPRVPTDPHILLNTLNSNKDDLMTIRDALTSYLTQLQVEERTFVNGLRLIERARKRPANAAYPEIRKTGLEDVTNSEHEPGLESHSTSSKPHQLPDADMHETSSVGDPSADVLTTLMDELDRNSDPEDDAPLGSGRHIDRGFGNGFEYVSEPDSDDDDEDTGDISFTRRILQKFANEAA